MEVQIKGEAAQQPPPQKGGSWFWGGLTIFVVVLLVLTVGYRAAIDLGFYTPAWMEAALTPQSTPPTAESRPTPTRAPAVQQQAQPTAMPALQVDPAAPALVPAALPVETADDAPAELQGAGSSFTRGTICFDEWYYVDGIRSNTRCVGGGGD